jgi:hypothetical protein
LGAPFRARRSGVVGPRVETLYVFSAVFESFSSSSSSSFSAVFRLAGTGEDGRGISEEF